MVACRACCVWAMWAELHSHVMPIDFLQVDKELAVASVWVGHKGVRGACTQYSRIEASTHSTNNGDTHTGDSAVPLRSLL